MQAVMSSTDKYSQLSASDRGIIDQLIDFALYRDSTNPPRDERKEEKKEEKKEER